MSIAPHDFEVYSEAGYEWNGQKWQRLAGANKYGISAVGAAVYAEHPSTEVLSLAYAIGHGRQLWVQDQAPPVDLFEYIASGQLLEAWNVGFEYRIWLEVCHKRMGWPMPNIYQFRDAMAQARAFGLPGSLDKAGEILGVADQKLTDGKRLIKKFCCPRQPTKKNKATRIYLHDDPEDAANLFIYNDGDILTETQAAERLPELPPDELAFWQQTLVCNQRGVQIDMDAVHAAIKVLEVELAICNEQISIITNEFVTATSQNAKIVEWLNSQGVFTTSIDAEHLEELLKRDLSEPVRQVLLLRQKSGSAGVKKIYAMRRMACKDGRVRNLFNYHGAGTGRDTASGLQPQNLVKDGAELWKCPECDHVQKKQDWCNGCKGRELSKIGWKPEYTNEVIDSLKCGHFATVSRFGDPVAAISGCIRGMFISAPGKDLICSDYTSIEAVVTACLAGEQWRIDAFERGDDIYLASCEEITGRNLEWYRVNGYKSHPDRQKYGKPAELGLGFGGGIGAWRQFDKTDNFDDAEVKRIIQAWRKASPAIVELWGGQVRGVPWDPYRYELFGLEGMAIKATLNPGTVCTYRGISFEVRANDLLYCTLPSGRERVYHKPRLSPSDRWEGQLQLSYEGWNTNPKKGKPGWIRMKLYGGLLTENVVQATARDILRDAVIRLERLGYPIVLRIHDELVSEVPEGVGSVEEFEAIMSLKPAWCANWPIKVAGGYRAKRYRKD